MPYSVHMTYQYGDHHEYPWGKRQRLRESQLWRDEDSYYSEGNFLYIDPRGASLPLVAMPLYSEGRDAVRHHFHSDSFFRATVKAALGLALSLNRILILPRAYCYCDKVRAKLYPFTV